MRLLMIDNYDSFTFNLVQYLQTLGAEVKVVRNDALSVDEIAALQPSHIVVSPGPCTPNEAGVSLEVIRRLGANTPILGVCLGHQSIGQVYGGNVIRAGIEFDSLGRRVAYHLYRAHPEDGALAPMSGNGGIETVRVDASEILHLFRPLRPGQIRGEPWLARALVKLNELDQYDDAELVRKKTAAMFAGFITRLAPEDNLMGEGVSDTNGVALAGLEPGTLQILEPGEDVKFSQPADVGASYADFLRMQFRAVAAAMGVTYEQLTGDLTQVNYSSIRAGLLEFRRRCEALQHGVIVHQLCRPIWQVFIEQAVLEGSLSLPGYARGGQAQRRAYLAVKWIPQGWQWVDPQKEFNAMLTAMRAGLLSRSEAISSFGYDAEDIDREIAADNARADALGLVFESDPRHDLAAAQPVVAPPDNPENP